MGRARRYSSLAEILNACIPNGDCLEWTGSYGRGDKGVYKDKPNYPVIYFERKMWRGNRLVWRLVNGPIPEGLFICHTCDNRRCVNPKHLYAGTAKQNAADNVIRKRHSKLMVRFCPRGHEYSPDNTIIEARTDGRQYRRCHICRNEIKLRSFHRVKARKKKKMLASLIKN